MKVVLFDLGNTLEIKVDGHSIPRDHAIETLNEIKSMRDINDQPPVLRLASDFLPVSNEEPLEEIKGKYYRTLEDIQIKSCVK